MFGKWLADEVGRRVADVEMDVVEAEPLDLMVDGARHDVARRQLLARIETLMKRWPVVGSLSCPPSPRIASVIRKFLTSRL